MSSQHDEIEWLINQDYLAKMNVKQKRYKPYQSSASGISNCLSRQQYMDMIQYMMDEDASTKEMDKQKVARKDLIDKNKQGPPQLPTI